MSVTTDINFTPTDRILEAVEKLAKVVGLTMGPKGKTVLLDPNHYDAPAIITKDGVSVAKYVYFEDKVMNLAAQTVKSIALKTAEIAGDGTTTSIVLANALLQEGFKVISENPMANVNEINKELVILSDKLTALLTTNASPLSEPEQLREVAMISTNQDAELSDILYSIFDTFSKGTFKDLQNCTITVEQGKTSKTEVEFSQGLEIDKGYVSHYFVNAPKNLCTLEKAKVLLYDGALTDIDGLVPILSLVSQNREPLVIIAHAFSPEIVHLLITNKMKNTLQVCLVESPGFGVHKHDLMKDIEIAIGGQMINDSDMETFKRNANSVNSTILTIVDKAEISRYRTTLIGGTAVKENVTERLTELKEMVQSETIEHNQNMLRKRIAKLTGGVAVIKIGGNNETQVQERTDRADDAIGSVKCALEDGIIIGGGAALFHFSKELEASYVADSLEKTLALAIMKNACEAPHTRILENAGYDKNDIDKAMVECTSSTHTMDAKTGKVVEAKIVGLMDPVKVTVTALTNAIEICSLLLTTSAVITID